MYTEKELNDLKTKTMVIYKITNLVNDKIYIGQTVNSFNQRYSGAGVGVERITHLKTTNEHLLRAIGKYGAKNFKVEIIEQCSTVEELNTREAHYIELYDSNNDEKGYNKLGGGGNAYWNWKTVLGACVSNEAQLERQARGIKRVSKKTGIHYKTITRDIYKEPIFAVSKKTNVITMYPNILAFCFRDRNGKPNISSRTDKRCGTSPMEVLVICKQRAEEEMYLSLKNKTNQTYEFYFCKQNPRIMEEYLKQTENIKEKERAKKEVEKQNKQIKNTHKCQLCGKEYTVASKYCADCKYKLHQESSKKGKTAKTCIHCGKTHYRQHETCSTQCTNKLRNIRKIRKNKNVTK